MSLQATCRMKLASLIHGSQQIAPIEGRMRLAQIFGFAAREPAARVNQAPTAAGVRSATAVLNRGRVCRGRPVGCAGVRTRPPTSPPIPCPERIPLTAGGTESDVGHNLIRILAVGAASAFGIGVAAGPVHADPEPTFIVGTIRNDWLVGTRHNDVILARPGNDFLFGRRGDDFCVATGATT